MIFYKGKVSQTYSSAEFVYFYIPKARINKIVT